eukprot:6317535-Prymnesium_polylepis.3
MCLVGARSRACGGGHARQRPRAAAHLEVRLVRLEHAVKPRQELLGAVVGVHDHGHAVHGRDGAHVHRAGDGASDRRLVVRVLDALAAVEGATALRDLDDHRVLGLHSGLEHGVDRRGRDAVDGRDGEALGLGPLEDREHVVAGDHAGFRGAGSHLSRRRAREWRHTAQARALLQGSTAWARGEGAVRERVWVQERSKQERGAWTRAQKAAAGPTLNQNRNQADAD